MAREKHQDDEARGDRPAGDAAPERDAGPQRMSGEQARQGRIVLTTRGRRMVFFGGLIGFVLLTLLLGLLWR